MENSGDVDTDAPIQILSGMNYTHVLFYDQYPTDSYVNEVVYESRDITGERILAKSFGKYHFDYVQDYKNGLDDSAVYICSARDYDALDYLESNGFELKWFTYMVVGWKQTRSAIILFLLP